MGIAILEEKYQLIMQNHLKETDRLYYYACKAAKTQKEMRGILNQLNYRLCSNCETKCCDGFPVEGWFSLEDYILFRAKYDKPDLPSKWVKRDTACYFLTPDGCFLPDDMRPFTCAKINCTTLTDSIKLAGKEDRFNQLKNSLDDILNKVRLCINGRN